MSNTELAVKALELALSEISDPAHYSILDRANAYYRFLCYPESFSPKTDNQAA